MASNTNSINAHLNANMNGSSKTNVNIITYNMRGFNQGNEYLKDLCDSNNYDVIFIDEHWCSPAAMHKIQNISSEYICYGISGMEAAVSAGFVKGRPFSGTAILVRKPLSVGVMNILTFERVISLEICNFLFINTYVPCEDGSLGNLNILEEIIPNVSEIIEQSQADTIIFGGDLNTNIMDKNTPHSIAINDFLLTSKLIAGQKIEKSSDVDIYIDYTFANEKLGRYSTIDFLCISNSLKPYVVGYEHLDSPVNHSNHRAVSLPEHTGHKRIITIHCVWYKARPGCK